MDLCYRLRLLALPGGCANDEPKAGGARDCARSDDPPRAGSAAAVSGGNSAAGDLHVDVVEVGAGLRAEGRQVLVMVCAGEALAVTDHIADGDVVLAAQPAHEFHASAHLHGVVEHFLVATADVLDADRGPVQPDSTAATITCGPMSLYVDCMNLP